MADFQLTRQNFANIYSSKTYHAIVDFDVLIQEKNSDNTVVIPLHKMVKALNIFHLHHKCFFPICTVKLVVQQSILEAIVDNIDNTTFRLNVDLFENATPLKITDFEDQLQGFMCKSVIKDCIMVANDFDKSKYKNEKQNKTDEDFKDVKTIELDIDLISKQHLTMQQELKSGTFEKVKLEDLTKKLLNDATKQKLLMQPINNQEIIPEVNLPNKNICQTIEFLQKTYGLYEKGLRLYFDYDRGYLLSNDVKDNAIVVDEKKNEYGTTIIYLGTNVFELSGCYADPETQTNYIVIPSPYKMNVKDTSVKLADGSNLLTQYFSQELEKIQNKISVNNDKILEKTKKVSNEIERVNKQFQDKINEIETIKKNVDASVNKYINRINNTIQDANKSVIKQINKGTTVLNTSLKNAITGNLNKQMESLVTGKNTLADAVVVGATMEANAIINSNINKITNTINAMAMSQLGKLTNGISGQLQQNSDMVYRRLGNQYNTNMNSITSAANKEIGKIKGIMNEINKPFETIQNITKNKGGLEAFINDDLLKKQRIRYQKYDNKFLQPTKEAEDALDLLHMELVGKNIDPTMLTINKYVRIAFMDNNYQEYKGAYQVVDVVWSFQSVSPHVHETACTFKVSKLIKGYLSND